MIACGAYVAFELLHFMINLGVAPSADSWDDRMKDLKISSHTFFPSEKEYKGYAWFQKNKGKTVDGVKHADHYTVGQDDKYYGSDVYMVQFAIARGAHGACIAFQVFCLLATFAVGGVSYMFISAPNERTEEDETEKQYSAYGTSPAYGSL